MPKSALLPHPTIPHAMIIPAEALRTRIDRYLHTLLPYRSLIYKRKENGFFVQITGDGPNDPRHMSLQGPYYFAHFAGLARMLNMFNERGTGPLPPVWVVDRQGREYSESPLPSKLRFQVITPALSRAIELLRAIPPEDQNKIWETIKANPHKETEDQKTRNFVKATYLVTDAVNHEIQEQEKAEEYEELTEEQERILIGLDPGR